MLEVKAIPNTKKAVSEFVKMVKDIYRDYPHWVAPIYSDQIKFIHSGPFNKIGEKQLFIAYRDGKPVARISAHVSHAHNKHYETNQGFFGWFEAYNDPEAVGALVKTAGDWLRERGCHSMMGPMNFAIYDEIGLLIDNFEDDPVVMCLYHPPYYQKLLEDVGFAKEIDWFAYLKKAADPIPETMRKISERLSKRSNVNIRNAKKKNWLQEVSTVRHIFEAAWSENWGNVPFSDEQWELIVKELKMIVKEELAFIIEVDGVPVGFSITIPDANYALKKAEGKLFPFGLFKILFNLNKITRVRTIIMGILEEYRKRGYDMALIHETIKKGSEMGITESDCSLIVENNRRLLDGLEAIGAYKYKTYRIFKKGL